MKNIFHKSVRLSLLVSLLLILIVVVSCAPLTDGETKGALAGQASLGLCGNYRTDLGEECDHGNLAVREAVCTSECKFTDKVWKIKVRVVKTCMAEVTDGSLCSSGVQGDEIQIVLNRANDIYARSLSKIRFVLDPAADYNFVKDNLIASRVLLNKPVSEIEKLTKKDLNNDGKFDDNDAKTLILKSGTDTNNARTKFASQYPSSIVVFSLANQNQDPEYDNSLGHWVVVKATGGWSGCGYPFIAMPPKLDGNLFAHESGHFFCNPHTMRDDWAPKTVAEAAQRIKDSGLNLLDPNNNVAVQNLFDGDKHYNILDTAANPGSTLFMVANGVEKCDPDLSKRIKVPVTFGTTSIMYIFSPDRTNIMSYYKTCFPDLAHFSPGQVAKHHETLQTINKRLLGLTNTFNLIDIGLLVEEMKKEGIADKVDLIVNPALMAALLCGNSIKDTGEECDDGNTITTDACSSCKLTKCGDGTVQKPNGYGQLEGCDDGNAVDTDSCTNVCKIISATYCGDGSVQAPNSKGQTEECDDGNSIYTDACHLCKKTKCGDYAVQKPNGFGQTEQCDDGNLLNGDGCSSTCLIA